MQSLQECETVGSGSLLNPPDVGEKRDDSELSEKPHLEKVHKVVLGVILKGHTPPQSYHDRMLMWKYLGGQEAVDFYTRKDPRYVFAIGAVGEVLAPFAREVLADAALTSGSDYLFMVDDDMMAPPDLFYKLAAHDKDIVAALAFTRNPDHRPVIYETIEGYDSVTKSRYGMTRFVMNYPKNKLVECDAVGFGAVLIKTEVFKKVPKPWFFGMAQTGEDITICMKARKVGFRVWMDTSLKLGHLGAPTIVTEEYSEVWNKLTPEEKDKTYGKYQKYETENMK
jgi:GT2 family glycosyltransferase